MSRHPDGPGANAPNPTPAPGRGGVAIPDDEPGRWVPGRVSLVWLLPLGAVLLAALLIWQAYVERGPLISIRFANAGGVTAGETRIRANDVNVGQVERVVLSEDLNSVVVQARLDYQLAPYIDESARFWIVNARINATEISGLATLLSGAYIGVDWDDEVGERQSEFEGLDEPPLTKRGTPGLRLTLTAEQAGYIYVGSPVLYRQIEVGRVERRRLAPDSRQVLFDIFIAAPYHRHVFAESRFYGVSGVDAELNADGVTVRLESPSVFITGGLAFDNSGVGDQATPVSEDGGQFRLYNNRREAQDSLFDDEQDLRFRYIAEFDGSVKGLFPDAAIEYKGLRVGRVVRVVVEPSDEPGLGNRVYAVLQFQPLRLGVGFESPEALLSVLKEAVQNGMRVQLATGNLLTGSLIIKLAERGDAEAASIDIDAQPYPALPTVASNVEAVTADVETLVRNLASLPIVELVNNANTLLADTRSLISDPAVTGLPTQVAASLASIEAAVKRVEAASNDLPAMISALTSASRSADDVLSGLSPDSEIYVELAAAARELRVAAKSIAAFAELLEENPNAVFTGR